MAPQGLLLARASTGDAVTSHVSTIFVGDYPDLTNPYAALDLEGCDASSPTTTAPTPSTRDLTFKV